MVSNINVAYLLAIAFSIPEYGSDVLFYNKQQFCNFQSKSLSMTFFSFRLQTHVGLPEVSALFSILLLVHISNQLVAIFSSVCPISPLPHLVFWLVISSFDIGVLYFGTCSNLESYFHLEPFIILYSIFR